MYVYVHVHVSIRTKTSLKILKRAKLIDVKYPAEELWEGSRVVRLVNDAKPDPPKGAYNPTMEPAATDTY
jgi:hypothetical protein